MEYVWALLAKERVLVNIEQKQQERATVVTVRERRLMADLAPEFKVFVLGAVKQGKSLLILDLSEVAVMDSSGLGALVSVLKGLGVKGELRVVGLSPAVRELFRLTRMDRVFKIYDDIATALGESPV